MSRWLAAVCVVVGSVGPGCSRAGDEAETKRWATAPPAKDIPVPATLHIAVTVDGAAQPAITSISLRGTPPDFSDDEHRAWLIPTLVPEARPAGTTIEAASEGGVGVKFSHPTTDGLEPVLFLTRRGDVIVSVLDPKAPFPRYHGQGGRLRRAGDPMPRISGVTRIAITHTTP